MRLKRKGSESFIKGLLSQKQKVFIHQKQKAQGEADVAVVQVRENVGSTSVAADNGALKGITGKNCDNNACFTLNKVLGGCNGEEGRAVSDIRTYVDCAHCHSTLVVVDDEAVKEMELWTTPMEVTTYVNAAIEWPMRAIENETRE
ncbi:hypothetical protein HS088_TW19G00928 [Tripterygium wilfordii]|uniref:Uncharacterized protein n=1 Tax=Tripterygium wilfordii TaxID=458696 RepID=A0A7J7CB55_TRIWF|nr:hypothetical protein HS088_TW19G00928 [Tripterygium wilfordii]